MNRRARLIRHLRIIGAVARVEALRLLLDRASIGLIVIVPAVQLVLFGYAVNLSPKNIPLVISPSCGPQAQLIERVALETGMFRLVSRAPALSTSSQYISAGRALAGADCRAGTALTLVADGSNPSALSTALAVLGSALLRETLGTESTHGISLPPTQWLYNPQARSAWFLAPGLVGVIVMITMLMLGSLTLVREREQGSWEGLLATPVTAGDALIGKLAPYLLVAVIQASVVVALASLLFNVPLRGSVSALLLASVVFALAHLALGFCLSALATNQVQAMQGAVFFYLPSMLLSGWMFPFEGMPRWARELGNVLPLTHFVRAARGVLLKGYGADQVLAETWPVATFCVGAACIALVSFRRQLD